MKKLLLLLLCLPLLTLAQNVPLGINYQAVARDTTGSELENQSLTVQFTILSDSTAGNISWQETHSITTNEFGLFTTVIGEGNSTGLGSSNTFNTIDWIVSNLLFLPIMKCLFFLIEPKLRNANNFLYRYTIKSTHEREAPIKHPPLADILIISSLHFKAKFSNSLILLSIIVFSHIFIKVF